MLFELLTLSAPILFGDPGTAPVELSHRRYREWTIELPAESFTAIGNGIRLGDDRTFAAELEGTNLLLDLDGDGVTDVRIEGDKGSALLRTEDGFRYAVRLARGANGWSYAASGSMSGKLGNTRIAIIDQDNDGIYGEVGVDAILIGRGKVATWLGDTLNVDGVLHTLKIDADGSVIELEPYSGPTGQLTVRDGFNGDGKILSAVVRSEDGRQCFDLAAAPGSVSVPVGNYRIDSGKVGMGTMAVTIGGGSSASMTVEADGSQEFEWGGPVRAEFTFQRRGDQVGFSPDQVWYYGTMGEEYQKWFPVGKSPIFVIHDQQTKAEVARAMFPGSS